MPLFGRNEPAPEQVAAPDAAYQYGSVESPPLQRHDSTTKVLPGFLVYGTQSVVSFLLSRTRFSEVVVSEWDLILSFLLVSCGYFSYKQKLELDETRQKLAATMQELHLRDLKYVASCDSRTRKRAETLYYKSQAAYYDLECEIRGEIRGYVLHINGLISILSELCLRSLQEINQLLRKQTLSRLSLKDQEIRANFKKNRNFQNFRDRPGSNASGPSGPNSSFDTQTQEQLDAITRRAQECHAQHSNIETHLEKFEEFFSDHQNEEFLLKQCEQQRLAVAQEIATAYSAATTYIENAVQGMDAMDAMDEKDEEGAVRTGKKVKIQVDKTQGQEGMLLDTETLEAKYGELPFEQLDFENDVDACNLARLIDRMEYERIVQEQKVRRNRNWKVAKICGVGAFLTLGAFAFWCKCCYDGETDVYSKSVTKVKGVVRGAREGFNKGMERRGIRLRV